jgi:hypothetical protein
MSYRHLPSYTALAFSLLTTAIADTLTLKDGRTINGNYLGGSARQVRMEVGDSIQTFEIDRISGIQFGSGAAAPAVRPADPPVPATQPRERVNVFRPDPASETTIARPGTEFQDRIWQRVSRVERAPEGDKKPDGGGSAKSNGSEEGPGIALKM